MTARRRTIDPERQRLLEVPRGRAPWRHWGPYVSERAWGTVREDYSADGTSWDYFPDDHARSRAYRWTEDGLAGICDDRQFLCLALAFWNGRDPILKERIFGLTGPEGNHGEDCKEHWFYLDSTPTHSWMRWRYFYPQAEFPYARLVEENRRRGRSDPEFELVDTGIFDDGRYWEITADYAKASPEDILLRITVRNAGPETAILDVLPTVWFRNTWSWQVDERRPQLHAADSAVVAEHHSLGRRTLRGEGRPELLFCEYETNAARLWGGVNTTPHPKDGINDHVVHAASTVNPELTGTKAALRYRLEVGPGVAAQPDGEWKVADTRAASPVGHSGSGKSCINSVVSICAFVVRTSTDPDTPTSAGTSSPSTPRPKRTAANVARTTAIATTTTRYIARTVLADPRWRRTADFAGGEQTRGHNK